MRFYIFLEIFFWGNVLFKGIPLKSKLLVSTVFLKNLLNKIIINNRILYSLTPSVGC